MSNKATQQQQDFAIVMLSTGAESEFARADRRHQARSSRRQLEIALQQFTNNGAQLECARLCLQRSRLPDRLRMRLKKR